MEKTHGLVTISKKSLFVFFNASAESVNCSLLEKSRKTFLQLTCKKNFVKHLKNLPQRLSENLSATTYRLPISHHEVKIYRLAVSPRAFSIIDYRYRFSTEKFIVPITGCNA